MYQLSSPAKMQLIMIVAALSAIAHAIPFPQQQQFPEDTSVTLSKAIAAVPDAQPQRISKRGYGIQSDGLSGPCKPVTIIFARGTLELGNIGLLAGPPFFDALALLIGGDKLSVQGVPYV